MADEEKVDVGSVQVNITSGAVHKAVRNILKNECGVDIEKIREEATERAREHLNKYLNDRLNGLGYTRNELEVWVRNAIEVQKRDLSAVVRQAVRDQFNEVMREELGTVMEAVISKGFEFKYGWNKTGRVKVGTIEQEFTDVSPRAWEEVCRQLNREREHHLSIGNKSWDLTPQMLKRVLAMFNIHAVSAKSLYSGEEKT